MVRLNRTPSKEGRGRITICMQGDWIIFHLRAKFIIQSLFGFSRLMKSGRNWQEEYFGKNIEGGVDLLNQPKHKVSAKTFLEIKFNPKDSQQQFYKETHVLPVKQAAMVKLGWKVADLERHQEDLALRCANLLTTQLLFPIHTFTNIIQYDQNGGQVKPSLKCLWVQQTIHTFAESKDVSYESNNIVNKRIFQFMQSVLLPRLKGFINKYLKWQGEGEQEYNEQRMMSCFYSEVIDEANAWIKKINSDKV